MSQDVNNEWSLLMSQLAGIFILGVLSGWLLEWIFVRLFVPNPNRKLETALQASRKEASALQQQNRELQAALTAAKAAPSAPPSVEVVAPAAPEVLETPAVVETVDAPMPVAETVVEVSTAAEPALTAEQSDDDLTRLTGIGPKLAEAMKAAGICTYAQLTTMSVEDVSQALASSNIRYNKASAESWAEQATLAAAGDWKGLKAHQAALKA
jgi:predicted flap endonuclease-1-like 5' DNA nuclease